MKLNKEQYKHLKVRFEILEKELGLYTTKFNFNRLNWAKSKLNNIEEYISENRVIDSVFKNPNPLATVFHSKFPYVENKNKTVKEIIEFYKKFLRYAGYTQTINTELRLYNSKWDKKKTMRMIQKIKKIIIIKKIGNELTLPNELFKKQLNNSASSKFTFNDLLNETKKLL